jgi:putative transposase
MILRSRERGRYVESFLSRLQDECLNVSWFERMWDARRKIAAWCQEFNEKSLRCSLGFRTSAEFAGLGGTA